MSEPITSLENPGAELAENIKLLTVKISVRLLFEESARTKIDKLQFSRFKVHDEIFILDVSVDDPLAVTGDDRLHYLAEEVPGEDLVQYSLLCDQIEQVLGICRSLHHVDKGVGSFVEVEKLDNSIDVLNRMK